MPCPRAPDLAGLKQLTALRVPIEDGGNPSPAGEAKNRVTGPGATLQAGSTREERPVDTSGVYTEISQIGAKRMWLFECEQSSDAADQPDYADRKSTRLNSSHRCISYAVF